MDPLFVQLQSALAGRFSVERELGRGGMGVVYLARDVALDRPVAIKLLPPALAADAEAKERFLREARTAAGLAHPHIVPIHLVEERDGLVFFVMTFVEGETLGERVRRAGPLRPAEAARVIREVAWALGYAHGRGVIHRDVKPDNVLLERGSGRAMVTDFGIARVATRGTVSQQGQILGTVQFMAPEQADPAGTVDGRSDLYALGTTAFYAITGRLPFEAPTAVALIAMHLTEPAPPIASVGVALPPRLADAVDRCLAKDPEARFATAEALAEALGEVAMAKPVPGAIIALRDAVRAALVPVSMGATAWLLAVGRFPVQAEALGWFTVAVGVAGVGGLFLAARQTRRDGLSQQDVVEGMTALSPVSASAAEVSRRQMQTLGRLVRHPVVRLAAVVLAGFYLWAVWTLFGRLESGIEVAGLLAIVAVQFGALALAVKRVRSSVLDPPERWTTRHRRLIEWLWGGAPARAFFRTASLGLGRAPIPSGSAPQPTEVLIGDAAESLFAALPGEQRGRLGQVPAVIAGVARAASALRSRRDELERALADAGPARSTRAAAVVSDITAARDAVAARHQAAVTALENLRLDLIRFRAGVGDAIDLTASLEEARRIGELVDAELAARREDPPG